MDLVQFATFEDNYIENEADIEQITEEIKKSGYITIEEVKSHLERNYM